MKGGAVIPPSNKGRNSADFVSQSLHSEAVLNRRKLLRGESPTRRSSFTSDDGELWTEVYCGEAKEQNTSDVPGLSSSVAETPGKRSLQLAKMEVSEYEALRKSTEQQIKDDGSHVRVGWLDDGCHEAAGPIPESGRLSLLHPLLGRMASYRVDGALGKLDPQTIKFLQVPEEETDESVAAEETSQWKRRRRQIWQLMTDAKSSRAATVVSLLLIFTILVSSVTMCVTTVASFSSHSNAAYYIETACIAVFTLEYVLKLVSTPNLMEFLKGPLNIVDLLAIVPWYLDLVFATFHLGENLPILRVIRLVRIFKVGERYRKINIVTNVMKDSLDMLMVLLFILFIAVIMSSTVMYYVERGHYNEELGYFVRSREPHVGRRDYDTPRETPFRSIPDTFWWCMVTLMTVGYGDVVPVTMAGKAISGILMLISLLILALPISVIGTNFTQRWRDYKERMKTCGTSSVPSRVELVEDLLSQLLQNVDDIIKHFVHTEHELELIRTRFQDRLNDNQASLERNPTSYGNSLKKHALKLQTSMDKSLRRELLAREKREFLELQRAEKKMNKHFLHLDDLMVAARLLRSRGFVRLLKQGRVKFRQMECLVDETQVGPLFIYSGNLWSTGA
eukprot:evm.model.scf_1979.3 EVM.evm.TU.scf_1979.3   scf_1979:16973-22042(-)